MVFFYITQLATHVFYDELHLKTSLMKKSIYILTLILLNLLTFSSTVNAQILEKKDTLNLDDGSVNGSFDIRTNNPLKKYLVNVNGIIQINDNTIALKTKDQFHAQIKIEVNKGKLKLYGIRKEKNYTRRHYYVSEGKMDTPVDINEWEVYPLNDDEKDITISIYKLNTNQLLEEKTYKLNPRSFFYCTPILCYTNINGKACKFYFGKITKSEIDFSKPLTLCVVDNLGRRYKVSRHLLKSTDAMHNVIPNPIPTDTLDDREVSCIRRLSKGKSIFISDIKYIYNGKERLTSPLEISIRE